MSRVKAWLAHRELQMCFSINRQLDHRLVALMMYVITHMGGATFTIACSLLLTLLAPSPWDTAGLQALLALGITHLPVMLLKKTYPRKRPHMALPDIRTYRKPLQDHSFPSGHTTAAFTLIVPFVAVLPVLAWLLLPLALTVALSRIYLGQHYPSDCMAGIVLGAGCTSVFVSLWPDM